MHLFEFLLRAGATKKEFADVFKMHHQQIYFWTRGSKPSYELAKEIEDATGGIVDVHTMRTARYEETLDPKCVEAWNKLKDGSHPAIQRSIERRKSKKSKKQEDENE